MTRRSMLRRSAAAAGALASIALVGCDDDDAAGISTPLPQAGGTLRFGTSLPISYVLDRFGVGAPNHKRICGPKHKLGLGPGPQTQT
jgi:hypothetical protein